MGVLYSIKPVTDESRSWFAQAQSLPPSSLPTDEQIREAARGAPGVVVDYSIDGDVIQQARLQRGDEHTVLNTFLDDDGERRMYFEKGWFTLVFDFTSQLARLCGPLIVIADSGPGPLLVPASDVDNDTLVKQGYATDPSLFGDPPKKLIARLLKRGMKKRERRMLVGKLPPVEHELVQKLGLSAGDAEFIALNADGDVVKVFMARVRGERPPLPEVILKLGVVRDPAYVYLFDKNGDLQRHKRRRL